MLRVLALAAALFAVAVPRPEKIGERLRPGMVMIYVTADAETFWHVDTVARDTTLGGRTGCVRMRIRMSNDDPVPETRSFCADSTMMYGWSQKDGHVALRPISTNARFETGGSIRAIYETGDWTTDRISGHEFAVLPTTITIRDTSSGKILRRVRERFSVGLATATGGVFEVPDSAAAGGWRQIQRFELIHLRDGQ